VAQGVPGRLRPQIFLTFRHYKGGMSSAKRTGRLYLRRNPWYSLPEAELTSGHMVLSGVPQKKSPVTPTGIDPRTIQPVAQHLNHYATPGLMNLNVVKGIKSKMICSLYILCRIFHSPLTFINHSMWPWLCNISNKLSMLPKINASGVRKLLI